MTTSFIDQCLRLTAKNKQLEAQNQRQADGIISRNIKILQLERKISALEWEIEQQAARVAKQGKSPTQQGPEWRKTALEQE